MSGLYEWVPLQRGQPLLAGAVMSGRTQSDGDVYVGRNGAGEVGKVNLDKGMMHNIWCHNGGDSRHCELLVLRGGGTVEWRPYKSGQAIPDGAVWAGVTKTDGRHGVYVGRDRHGACGKLNLTDGGHLCNLWVHGYGSACKEGEILLVHGGTYAPGPAPGVPMPMPSAPAMAMPVAQAGWNPNAQCDGLRAEERALYLQQNQGMTVDAARQQVMREFPAQFPGGAAAFGPMWNPNAMCDGKRAEERASWLQQNKGLSIDAARQQIIREFPSQFVAGVPTGGVGVAVGGYGGSPQWNPNAMCDGSRAEERANWLQQNKGMTMHAARQQIMKEFSAQFGAPAAAAMPFAPPVAAVSLGGWNPNAQCDGVRAEERVLYLQQKEGMTVDAARQKVMREFPAQFAGVAGPVWNPNAMCDGKRAEERATWLQQNQGLSMDAARNQIIREFPAQFGAGAVARGPMWNPNAMCDAKRAEERATWLQQNKGLTIDAARRQVMNEFPAVFR